MSEEIIVTIPLQLHYYRSDIELAVGRHDKPFADWLFNVGPLDGPYTADDLVEGIIEWLHEDEHKESFTEWKGDCIESAEEYLDWVVCEYVDTAMPDYSEEFSAYQLRDR